MTLPLENSVGTGAFEYKSTQSAVVGSKSSFESFHVISATETIFRVTNKILHMIIVLGLICSATLLKALFILKIEAKGLYTKYPIIKIVIIDGELGIK